MHIKLKFLLQPNLIPEVGVELQLFPKNGHVSYPTEVNEKQRNCTNNFDPLCKVKGQISIYYGSKMFTITCIPDPGAG